MRIRRVVAGGIIAVICAGVGVAAWDVATYDRDAWLADFARVKRDMARGYANLDWAVEHGGVDLEALDRRTTNRLERARSRVRAFLAIRDFVGAFQDPHLRISPREESTPQPGGGGERADPPAGADCEAAGYEQRDYAFTFPFDRLPGWTPLSQGDFPSGIAGDVGVLRVASLAERHYLGACEVVHRAGIGERALQLAVRARQQRRLRDSLADLRPRGARRLILDLTGNGGGSEWATEVAGLFTDRVLYRTRPRVVAPRCDRNGVWRGESPLCPPFSDETLRDTLVGEGAWRGPVLILVDGETASAAEEVVAWLRDNAAARVVGQRTLGAGCGYVDGGTVTRLSQLPLDVWMPNCTRYLADGTNELEGIAPDHPLPDGPPSARVDALATLLNLD